MKHLRLAALAAWFTFALAMPAHAGLVGAAIGWLTTTTIGKLVFGIALHVGASLLQKAMQPKQREPGITGQVQVGGTRPLSFIIGSYATAGHLEYIGTYGRVSKTPNAGLVQVITLSDLPSESISNDVWADGKAVTRDPGADVRPNSHGWWGTGSHPFTQYLHGNYYFLFAKYFLGEQTEADPLLVSRFGGDRSWSSDMIGRGLTYVILSAEVRREFFKGIPAARWQVDGIRLYDPRLDSTVGGSGSHRWGNESTYEFSNNPAVMIYNVLRGIYYQGQWVYGPELPASALPLSNWMAAMNECERPIDLEGGGSEPQFRAGMEIMGDMEPKDVIAELLIACNGEMAEMGGTYKIHVGAPSLPVFVFSDDDIEVLNNEQSYDPHPGYENTFNGVSATYPEPAAMWEMKEAPDYVNAGHVAEDGGERLAPIAFSAVPFATQVQRLMRSKAEDNRRFRVNQLTLGPQAFLLEPLDVVAWNSNRNGFDGKHHKITAMEDLAGCCQNVALREIDPSDYSWSPSFQLPWFVGTLAPNRPPPQVISGWSVAPDIIYDDQGRPRRPAIRVYFDGDLEDIREVRIVVRKPVTHEIVSDALIPYGDPDPDGPQKTVVVSGQWTLPNEPYEVSGILIPFGRTVMDWSAWLPVTTPDVRLGDLDVYVDVDLDGINEAIDRNALFIGQEARELRDRLRKVSLWSTEQDAGDALDRQELRRSIVATAQGVEARFEERIDVIVTDVSAMATRVSEFEVIVPILQSDQQATASLVTQQGVRISQTETGIDLIGQDIATINLELGDKASVSSVNALTNTVSQQGGTINILGTSVSDIQAALNGYMGTNAVASAFSARVAEINAVGNQVTAVSNSLSMLETQVGNVASSVTVRGQAVAGPGGGYSTYAIQVRTGASSWDSSAMLLMEAHASQPSRIGLIANQTFFTNSATGARYRPVVIQNNQLIADQLLVNWANIINANIQWAQINTAVINNLTVVDGMIPAGLITDSDNDNQNNTSFNVGTSGNFSAWQTLVDITVNSPSGHPIQIFYDIRAQITSPTQNNQTVEMRLLRQTGTVVRSWSQSLPGVTLVVIEDLSMIMEAAGSGNQRLRIQVRGASNSTNPSGTTRARIIASVPRF